MATNNINNQPLTGNTQPIKKLIKCKIIDEDDDKDTLNKYVMKQLTSSELTPVLINGQLRYPGTGKLYY